MALAIGVPPAAGKKLAPAPSGRPLPPRPGRPGRCGLARRASRTEIGQLLPFDEGHAGTAEFSDERLAPLLDLPGKGVVLLDTLEVCHHSGGRKTEAATGSWRSSGSRSITGSHASKRCLTWTWKDGDTVLALHLAIMINRLL